MNLRLLGWIKNSGAGSDTKNWQINHKDLPTNSLRCVISFILLKRV